ncbi:MAG TPA: phosphotransferase [Mycobacteriales bacterium]|nr:phosphotransferase [Mycobacteriales bacterium]
MSGLAVDAALRGFALTVDALDPIATWNSAVFRLRTRHGTYALRVHQAGGRHPDVIRGELAFLRHLRSHGLPVPQPLQSSCGEDLFTGTGVDGSTRYFDVTTWMGGVVRRNGLDVSDADRLGATLARIHLTSLTFTRMPERIPPVHSDLWLLAEASADDVESIAPWFSPGDRAVLERALAGILPTLAQLDSREREAATLHNDFILGNCLWQDGKLSVVDFADAAIGPLVYDLAPMLTNIGDEPILRSAFLAGYRSQRPLSANQEAVLPMLEAVRHVAFCFDLVTRAAQGRYGPPLDVHLPHRVSELRLLIPLL